MGSDNSKEKYRQALKHFCTHEIAWNNHKFWGFLFTSWQGYEIFELLRIGDIRILREKQPSNLATLIFKCCEQVILYDKEEQLTEQLSVKNSVLYLNRILPIVFEHNSDKFVTELFQFNMIVAKTPTKKKRKKKKIWRFGENETPDRPKRDGEVKKGGAEDIKEDNKENIESMKKFQPYNPVKENVRMEVEKEVGIIFDKILGIDRIEIKKEIKKKIQQISLDNPIPDVEKITQLANDPLKVPLYQKLVFILLQSLFSADLTIPKSQIKPVFKKIIGYPRSLDVNLLWVGGLAVPKGKLYPQQKQVDNRKMIMKCLMSTISSSLYQSQVSLDLKENLFLKTLVSKKSPFSANLFYSLLNVAGSYNPTGTLPYSSIIFADNLEEITLLSVQLLALLLCSDCEDNIFIRYVKAIDDTNQFKYLFDEVFLRLFQNIIDSDNTYFPNSQKNIVFVEELFVVFWKFIEHNHKFRAYISRNETSITTLLSIFLYGFNKNSKIPQQFPQLQLISFIILLLSEERLFAVSLNKKFKESMPLKIKGLVKNKSNYFDFLILLFHKLIMEDKGVIVRPLFNCMLTIIQNISPYARSLSISSSIKLLNLFELFVRTPWLYGNDSNYDLVNLLLCTFNNIIQYQYSGNANLIYSILRKQNVFVALSKPVNLQKVLLSLKKKKIPFTPTVSWIKSWKGKLPIQTVLSLLQSLLPEIENYCSEKNATEEDVLNYIKNSTLVGILPVPHSIIIRSLRVTKRIHSFLAVYVWSLIYVKELGFIGLNQNHFDPSKIRLFTVRGGDQEN